MQLPDPRNEDIVVHVNGSLVPRAEARVSVFDSVVQGGDAVWEGLRVYRGRIAALGGHLDRLQNSAKTLAFENVPESDAIRRAIFETLEANGMTDEAHIRLTLTRGEKVTSGMNPRFNQSGCSLIVLAEWKPPVYSDTGIRAITASVRRNTPQCLDSKIHHNNLLNNILACIEANVAGADTAIMLDIQGFVSETNDTNLFIVKDNRLLTPFADACLPGLTRQMILDIAAAEAIDARRKRTSRLPSCTPPTNALPPERWANSRRFSKLMAARLVMAGPGPMTRRLQSLHREFAYEHGEKLPFA